MSILASKVVKVTIKSNFKIIEQDPDDDIVLEVAEDGVADYIVSGDPHLLRLGNFQGIPIVSVSQMLGILRK